MLCCAVGFQQASEEVNLNEIAEERRLGVLTDRQESSAIGLIQTWAELDAVSRATISLLLLL